MALLYERICAHVLEQLRRGALRPGDRVPSEMELAVQFGVSRITSKRALEVLREAGLVERIRGKGTFVVRRLPDLSDLTIPLRPTPRREARSIALIVPDMSEGSVNELSASVSNLPSVGEYVTASISFREGRNV